MTEIQLAQMSSTIIENHIYFSYGELPCISPRVWVRIAAREGSLVHKHRFFTIAIQFFTVPYSLLTDPLVNSLPYGNRVAE